MTSRSLKTVLLLKLIGSSQGFCVCPRTNDPKLVKFTFIVDSFKINKCKPWKAEVYNLSSGVWRTLFISLPGKTVALTGDQEVLDGFIYFLSIDSPVENGVLRCKYLMMSFDIVSEEFTKICTPDCYNTNSDTILTMSKLRESIVLLACETEGWGHVYDVWTMEGSVTKSFRKVFRIDPPDGSVERVVGFRKNGEVIIVMKNDEDDESDDDNEDSLCPIFAYDPTQSKWIILGFLGKLIHSLQIATRRPYFCLIIELWRLKPSAFGACKQWMEICVQLCVFHFSCLLFS